MGKYTIMFCEECKIKYMNEYYRYLNTEQTGPVYCFHTHHKIKQSNILKKIKKNTA